MLSLAREYFAYDSARIDLPAQREGAVPKLRLGATPVIECVERIRTTGSRQLVRPTCDAAFHLKQVIFLERGMIPKG